MVKGDEMRNYNPMSMFDNSISMFNSIEAKQKEYIKAVLEEKRIKKELEKLWKTK
jgi:hypothetical protein